MEITRDEFESAALVVIVKDDGTFQWSSHKSTEQVAIALSGIAEEVRKQSVREMAAEIERGDWDV